MSVNNVSPASFIGGIWTAWGTGRVPVGVNTSIQLKKIEDIEVHKNIAILRIVRIRF